MKTHDVEEQLGITKQALIYYEKEGLINPIRDKNNYRQYTQNDIEILQVILLLRSFEISIDEIKLILSGKLSIRSCLGTKQNYLKNEKDKKTVLTKVEYVPIYMYKMPTGISQRYKVLDIKKAITNYESGQDMSIGQQTYTMLQKELGKIKATMGEDITFE